MPDTGGLSGTAMAGAWWKRATQNQRRRAIEFAGTLVIAGGIVWQYGSLAPQVIVVLSYGLSLFVALVQLPFLAGYFGIRRLRPVLVASLVVLPFLIALGYSALYGRDLFLIWYWEWLGGIGPVGAVLMIAALPVLSFLAGLMSRKMRKS